MLKNEWKKLLSNRLMLVVVLAVIEAVVTS